MTTDPKDTKPAPLLMLAALGVVFGDLGTSPLYTVQAVAASFGGRLTPQIALGSLSLIVWTLIVTLCVKYCLFVMRADNHGEGGILALTALIGARTLAGRRWLLAMFGLFGAALIYGDGIITPAISVLSALEGVKAATPGLAPYVLPVSLAVLVGIFWVQQFGTARIGLFCGPVMLAWFGVIALLGVINLMRYPAVLAAINPIHVLRFFQHGGWRAFLAMGGVFLCATGGEALYADIGHFGRGPIRAGWYTIVFPALVLNYAGQIGNLVANPNAIANPFFLMGPGWAIYPLVALATLATIIASQAIITGAFSLTRQAISLGWLPGMTIIQTSKDRYGQIYVPTVNWLMMLATLALVLAFGSSARLAGAYGMAVSATMLLTTILLASAMRRVWHWRWPTVLAITAVFLVVDAAYCAANLVKLLEGGWIPLCLALLLFTVMTSWRAGLDAVHRRMAGGSCSKCLALIRNDHIPRVPGVAVFLSRMQRAVPALLTQHIRHMGALQETVIVLSVMFMPRPRVAKEDRASAEYLGEGVWRATVRFGFMERPDLLAALQGIDLLKQIDFPKVIFFGARDLVVHDTRHPRLSRWRLALFALLFRNAVKTMDRFQIPPENFVEIAREVRI
jgi:KUP system potassium uptake protein